jgi:hypothetical protein
MHRMLKLVSVFAAFILPVAPLGAQGTQTIDFEGLGFGVIPAGYAGMTWSSGGFNNWYVAIAGGATSRTSSGSGNAFSDEGSAISFLLPGGTFNLNSMFLSEMLSGDPDRTDIDLMIVGKLNGVVVQSMNLSLDHSNMVDYTFNWSNINEVDFSAIKGRLLVDDISITATPEPASLTLLGTGLAVVGIASRRRRRGISRD